MAVYDRWHVANPEPGAQACKCGKGRNRLYPSAAHGTGKRWQVQWEDPNAPGRKRPKRNFALKDGDNPNLHAEAFDKLMQGQIVSRTYTDPRAGEVRLQDYAEAWRPTRGHNAESAAKLAARLRNHVYEDRPGSGRSPRGALAIGQYPMALLAQRPTLTASWVTSLKGPLPAERSRRQVADDVTAVFAAAVEDGIIGRNPMKSSVVDQPGRGGPKAQPFTAAELEAIEAALPERLRVLSRLGAGTGAREMELAALGVHDFQFLGKRPKVRVERQLKKIDGRLVWAPLKNRKPHDVPLAPSVALAVQRHLMQFPARETALPWHEPGSRRHGETVTVKLLLRAAGGGPLTRAALVGTWTSAAAKAAGSKEKDRFHHPLITGWNIHRMRHTYASAQLRAGTDIVRVAAAMGDTVAMVSSTYAHLMRDDDGDRDLRDAVDDFFAPRAPDVPSQEDGDGSAQAGER